MFQKCSVASTPFDADCGRINPYEIVYKTVILVTVDAGPSTPTNSDIQFTVVIGNACETNTLTISPKASISYYLRTPPVVFADRMTVVQKYSFCPYECSL